MLVVSVLDCPSCVLQVPELFRAASSSMKDGKKEDEFVLQPGRLLLVILIYQKLSTVLASKQELISGYRVPLFM